nr:hypothetical protein [Bradyrhizobium diazoefficiens]
MAELASWLNDPAICDALEMVTGALVFGLLLGAISAYVLKRWRG